MEGYNPVTGSDIGLLEELLPNEPNLEGRPDAKIVRKSEQE